MHFKAHRRCVMCVILQSTESARDFLLGKLKDAEYAIKSAMAEQVTLQRQAETDHEVTPVAASETASSSVDISSTLTLNSFITSAGHLLLGQPVSGAGE